MAKCMDKVAIQTKVL